MVHGHVAQDERQIPLPAYHFPHPVFYGACLAHPVFLPRFAREGFTAYAAGELTVHQFIGAAGWVMLTHPGELNTSIHAWLEGSVHRSLATRS